MKRFPSPSPSGSPSSATTPRPCRRWARLLPLPPSPSLKRSRSRDDAEIVPAVGAAASAGGPWRIPSRGSFPPHNVVVPAVGAAASAGASQAPDEDDSDSGSGSGSEMSTDEEDDRHHGYLSRVARGDALRVTYHSGYKSYVCPVCPGKAPRWKNKGDIESHVIGMATSTRLRNDYKKKWCRHRVLARNEGWM